MPLPITDTGKPPWSVAKDMTPTFKIECTPQGNCQVVVVQGSMSNETHLQAKEALLELLAGNPTRILLDLGELTYISSSGLGLLVAMFRRCRQRGISLPLCGLRSDIRELFKVTRLDQVFEIFADQATALNGYGAGEGTPPRVG